MTRPYLKRPRPCMVDECDAEVEARELCSLHYQRSRKHGDPRIRLEADPPIERLLARVEVDEGSACWRFLGARSKAGYGQLRVDGRAVYAHRFAFEFWVGPVPEGCEIDHVWALGCAHRDCVNPDHMEAVSPSENARRGNVTRWSRR